MSCGPSYRAVRLFDFARAGWYTGAVTDAMRLPEHVALEKEPIGEDYVAVCDVQTTHAFGVARGERERGEAVRKAED
eukprot:1188658-Pleurochrysis_carterae.AAC.1